MNSTNNERARLQRKLDELRAKRREMMKGRVVPSARAQMVQGKIVKLENEIARIDREAAERIALSKAPIDEILEVIAIPLLADVMNDLVAGVDGMLRRHGAQETIFGDYTRQIRRAALSMVDTLAVSEAEMPRLLDVDDTLVSAVKKKLMSFIKQRLNITK